MARFDPLALEPSLLRRLAERGRFDVSGIEGTRALDRAIDRGRVDAALALLEAGADPNRPLPREWPPLSLTAGPRPLEMAVALGDAALITELVSRGGRLELSDGLLRRAPDVQTRDLLRRLAVHP